MIYRTAFSLALGLLLSAGFTFAPTSRAVEAAADAVPVSPPPSPAQPVPDATVPDPARPGSTVLVTPPSEFTPEGGLPLAEGVPLLPPDARSMAAVRLSADPTIDGELDDPEWKQAGITGPFSYQNGPPAFPTVARYGYTADAIYVAWQCWDAQPHLIQAQQTKRDGDMDRDDKVTLEIDPLNDKRTTYRFTVNPLGTTSVDIPGGSSQNVGWRGDWKAAAKLTPFGWQAEMAIPFELLRYPSGQTVFGLVFRRHIERLDQSTDWPRNASDNQTLELEWLNLQAPKIQRKPVFLPYTLFGYGDNITNSAGLDIKYTTDRNVTNLLTLRPDFQTIEDSVQSVDFTYGARFVEDRRPFFTEGGNYFGDSRLIYGRRIEKVDVGLKSFGKIGKFSFGGFDTIHFGGDNNLVGNLGYDLSPTSNAGFAFAHHRGSDGLRNTVMRLGFDQNWPQDVGGTYFSARAYKSLTKGHDEPGNGLMLDADLGQWSGWGKIDWSLSYSRVPSDFFPALGFLREKDYHGFNVDVGYGQEMKRGPLLNWRVGLDVDYYNFEESGKLFRKELNPEFGLNFRNHLYLGFEHRIGTRVPNRDRTNGYEFGWLQNDIYRSGFFNWRTGRLNGGRYLYYSFRQGWRLGGRWSVSFSHERYRIRYPQGSGEDDEGDSQTLYGLVYDLTPERSIAGRVRSVSGKISSFLAFRQELLSGRDMYLILGDPNSETSHPFKRVGLKLVNAY